MSKVLLVVVLGALAMGALAQPPSPLGLVPQPVPGLSVAIWTERAQYQLGETVRFFVSLSQPAYLYIFNIDPAGHIRLLFPNIFSPNPHKPAGIHTFPDGAYVFRVVPPTGLETLQVVACPRPLPGMPTGTHADPFPLLAPDPAGARARILALIPAPGVCATAWTTFHSLPTAVTPWPCPPWFIGPPPPCPPPTVGWWIVPGVCWYFDPATGQWQFVVGPCPPAAVWCWCLGPDWQWRWHFRICIGRCD